MKGFKERIKIMLGEKREILVRIKYAPLNFLCALLPMKKEIILESHPSLTDNTFELFRCFLKHKLNQSYKIVWLVDSLNERCVTAPNVDYLEINPQGIKAKLLLYIRCNRAAAVISSNRHRGSFCGGKKQLNIYLDHGSQLKKMANRYGRRMISFDYLLVQSDFFVTYNMSEYIVDRDQIFIAGLPRNDQLYRNNDSVQKLIGNNDYEKIIIWVPTFRQHNSKTRIDCDVNQPLGLPILYNDDEVRELDSLLKSLHCLLIIKPHPAQNNDIIKEINCSNIRFYYNSDLQESQIQLNELLQQTDGMITDYSSVYYDYLLLDKPICITLDDYDDYYKQKGFVFDEPLEVIKGFYAYTAKDLMRFVKEVAMNIDSCCVEREKTKNLLHDFQDGKSSERVYEFINAHLKV